MKFVFFCSAQKPSHSGLEILEVTAEKCGCISATHPRVVQCLYLWLPLVHHPKRCILKHFHLWKLRWQMKGPQLWTCSQNEHSRQNCPNSLMDDSSVYHWIQLQMLWVFLMVWSMQRSRPIFSQTLSTPLQLYFCLHTGFSVIFREQSESVGSKWVHEMQWMLPKSMDKMDAGTLLFSSASSF